MIENQAHLIIPFGTFTKELLLQAHQLNCIEIEDPALSAAGKKKGNFLKNKGKNFFFI